MLFNREGERGGRRQGESTFKEEMVLKYYKTWIVCCGYEMVGLPFQEINHSTVGEPDFEAANGVHF